MNIAIPLTFVIIAACFNDCLALNDIETSSDTLSVDPKKNTCEFFGNAKVSYIKSKDNQTEKYTFNAEKINILYDSKNINIPKKIDASSNVNFKNNYLSISANTCSFDMTTVNFIGNVIVKHLISPAISTKTGTIHADKATYNIITKNIDITSKSKVKIKINGY